MLEWVQLGLGLEPGTAAVLRSRIIEVGIQQTYKNGPIEQTWVVGNLVQTTRMNVEVTFIYRILSTSYELLLETNPSFLNDVQHEIVSLRLDTTQV